MKTILNSVWAPIFTAIVLLGFATAQNSTCNDSSSYMPFYNASGSASTPGFRVNESYPATTWTWTRYVADVPDGPGTNNVHQTLGLQTSPLQNLSDAASLPYTGCLIALVGLSALENGTDDGTCTSVIGSDCVREIISVVNASAAGLSGAETGSSDSVSCPSLLDGLSSGCSNLWTATNNNQFLPNNFTNLSDPDCSNPVNKGNSNSTSGAFFGWGDSESTARGDFTVYDNVISTSTPIIVTTWLKATSNVTDIPSTVVTNSGWADTKLICLPANVIEAGSRNVTKPAADSAGRRVRMGSMVFTATLILIVLMA
ncbi:hypothetical protein PVAG01_09670 [Phlyctema vagabunda]|uniref:Uncharacterized protein n=1 Tax=Phlyctema vagabunda TaxID=108571 RepID=A0ABR4P807_9HELO